MTCLILFYCVILLLADESSQNAAASCVVNDAGNVVRFVACSSAHAAMSAVLPALVVSDVCRRYSCMRFVSLSGVWQCDCVACCNRNADVRAF